MLLKTTYDLLELCISGVLVSVCQGWPTVNLVPMTRGIGKIFVLWQVSTKGERNLKGKLHSKRFLGLGVRVRRRGNACRPTTIFFKNRPILVRRSWLWLSSLEPQSPLFKFNFVEAIHSVETVVWSYRAMVTTT